MKISPKMSALFAPTPERPATLMDRTTAVAREITEAATQARNEATARLRAKRLELEAIAGPADPAPAKKAGARKTPKS
jgi:hypothetical protein